MMTRTELCAWLRANSSGIYRPAADAADEIERLERALAFYADPTRYHGPNQPLEDADEWSEQVGLRAYRLDVTRDQGVIARSVLGSA